MMEREQSNIIIIKATVKAMKEKLDENQWKKPIIEMELPQALIRMKEEIGELSEELSKPKLDYAAIRRELADVVNFAGAAINDCDRRLFKFTLWEGVEDTREK